MDTPNPVRTRRHRLGGLALVLILGAGPGEGLTARTPAPRVEVDPTLTLARAGMFDRASFSEARGQFALRVGEIQIDYQVFAVTALPGQNLDLHPLAGGSQALLRHAHGSAVATEAGGWRWTAPVEPGLYPLRVEDESGAFVHLNVLVMHERNRVVDGTLNGYAIGSYRAEPLRGDPVYLPPVGFIEAAPADEDVLVSPHFTLGQFLCKQPGEPRYLALSVPLVQKLEALLSAVNEAGIHAPSLRVMSGFRTPAYNASIGNRTVYSRHLWGDAADVYVDVDGDRQMDDLNGDGRSDFGDAQVLFGIADALERGETPVRDGGLGVYRRNAAHGPFVHVDARGHAARW